VLLLFKVLYYITFFSFHYANKRVSVSPVS